MSITLRNIKGSPLTHDEMDDNFSALTGSLGAGNGLTGGGFLTTGVEFNVGQGDGISVSADGVAVNDTVARTGSNAFTGPQNIQSSITASSALLGGFTYPTTDSSYGFVLATDGAGNLFFQEATSGSITSSGAVFPFTGSAGILGSLNVDGTISATTSVTVNDYTLPLADGASGSLVTTDGSGTLSFGTVDSLITFDNVEINVKAGEAITKGDPVYISGTVGASERAIVSKADASNSAKMPAIGLAQEDMATNDLGKVTLSGFLRNITTDPIDGITPSSNDTVYVKAGGGLTLTKPSGSNLIQNIAKVGKVSGANGGTLIVSAILRTNDVPNLLTGEVFYGVGDKAVHKPLSDILSGSEFTYSGSFSGSFVGPSINVTSGSFNRLDVTGNSTLDGDLTVTGRVTAEEFHTEFVSASIIYQSGSTKFGDTSDDRHSFTGSIEILGSLTGSSNIDIAGTVDANVYSINGTTVIDSSRNITGSNGTFSGNVGIGTTSPDEELDVRGQVQIKTNEVGYGLNIYSGSRQYGGFYLDTSSDDYGMALIMKNTSTGTTVTKIEGRSNSTRDTFFNHGGNVGIGTASPSTKLEVNGTITGTNLDVSGEVEGNSFAVNNDTVITSGRVINNITQANVDNLRLDGNTLSNTATDQNVTIEATGTGILDVNVGSNFQNLLTVQNDIYPEQNYVSNIGAINKKFLSLNVAELIVETLVASERRSTVGGRFNVGIGTQLSQSISPSSTSILVENNNLNSGDIIHLETGGNVEFMRVDSAASSGSGDGFSYDVTRNLDGTGANTFDAGSGVFNTGQIGNGFIDQYAINSLTTGANTAGPTIAFMERTGSAFQDIDVRTTVGNLKGWYGYSTEIFGFAAGNYREQNITVDPINGLRIRNVNTLQLQASGSTLTIGDNFIFNSSTGLLKVSGSNIELESPTFFLGNNSQFISGSNGNLRIESTNFTLAQNGDVSMTGTVTAEAGQIGGFAITDSAITGSGFFLSGSATGNQFFISASNFNVKANGDVTASNADISGNIVAQSGTIGGFNIATDLTAGSGLLTLKGSSGQITGSNVLFTGGKISGSAIEFDVTEFVAKGDNVEISGSSFHLLNGNITASNVDLSGEINAESGTIGGFNIGSNLSNSAGSTLILKGSTGQITASAAQITGNITAQTGELQTLDVTGTLTLGASGNLISFDSNDYINLTNEVLDVRGRNVGSTQTIYLQTLLDGGQLDLKAAVESGTTDNINGASFTTRGFVVASQTNNDLNAPRDKNGALFGAGSNIIRANNVDNSIDFFYSTSKLGAFESTGDFYVDSDTFYVDAGGVNPGKVGINDSTPSYALDVNGDIRTTGILRVDDYARIDALRVGTTSTDPGDGNLYVENGITADSLVLQDDSGTGNYLNHNFTGDGLRYFIAPYSASVANFGDEFGYHFINELWYVETPFTVGYANGVSTTYKLDVNGTANIGGNLTIAGDINSTGTISGSSLDSSGDTIVRGNLTVIGDTIITGSVSGHPTISPVASDSNNSNGTVIQDLSFDSFGHVESVGTVDLDSRYLQSFDITAQTDPKYLRSDVEDQGTQINLGGEISAGSAAKLQVYGFQRTGPIMIAVGNTSSTSWGTSNELWLMNNSGNLYIGDGTNYTNRVFHDGYHPNADALTTSRTITLGGDLTGNVSFDGSANVTLTAAVVDDSHNHIISNVDGLQTALDGKLSTSGGTLTGNLIIGDKLLSSQNNTDVDTGTETVASVATGTYDAAFFDFVVKNGTNLRAGTVFAVHDGTNVEFTETSTQDLGDTSDVELTVDISSGNLRLRATAASDNWSIKAFVRGL